MTRRSNHTAKSTDVSRNTRTSTALMMVIQIESPASVLSSMSGGHAQSCDHSLHHDGVTGLRAQLLGDP